jgi:hypothetical protein
MATPLLLDVAPIADNATVVALANDLAGVQAADGALVPSECLGFGLVQGVGPRGDVHVYWLDADIDTWVAVDDLRPLGAGTHLITVWRHDRHDQRTRLRSFPALLAHHWTVELWPDRLIRVLRADGPNWTFRFNNLTRQVDPPWDTMLTDDAAEAIVAADLAVTQTDTGRGILMTVLHRLAAMMPGRHRRLTAADSPSRE